MHLVRPCTLDDVSSIESLVRDNHARISSLPRKRARLIQRIEQSMRSFSKSDENSDGDFFLFVIENTQTGAIDACSGIALNNEPKRPFYNYRLGELIHASERFDIHTPVSVLHLTHELTGRNVLCSFAIKEDLIDSELFHLVSRARLMFVRQFRGYFSESLVVELQGVYGDEGQSAFWDSLGRHFFNMDFSSAGYHVATKSRTLLAELMPHHPIYVSMLTQSAQEVLGKFDSSATQSYDLLQKEGFKISSFIDIFDGGPVMLIDTEKTKTFKDASLKTLREGQVTTGEYYMLANNSFEDFRCGMVQMTEGSGGVCRVSEDTMRLLGLSDGEEYFHAPL